ncbi:MAG: translocation/assembly module TamB [Muribaculaceae bacterium]|nr:translocation/assembly module TamB [Muribaculaceae bacterium]
MGKALKKTYTVVRSVVVTALVLVVVLFVGLYLLLSLPSVQNKVKERGEKELSEYLGTNVTIGEISFEPFNELTLGHVNIPDQQGDSLLHVERLGAGISIYELLVNRKIVITYGEIIGLHGRITRPDKNSPTNLQFILDAFKPKDDKPPKPFDLRINNVIIRNSDITYDVLSEPRLNDRFDPNHIAINNLRADLELPRLKNNDFVIDLKRLSLDERAGLMLNNLAARVAINDTVTTVNDLRIELPNSLIHPDDITLRYSSLKTMFDDLKQSSHQLRISGSYITPSDLRCFAPQLAGYDDKMDLTLAVDGTLDRLHVPVLSLEKQDGGLDVSLNGTFDLPHDGNALAIDVPYVKVNASRGEMARVMELMPALSPQAAGILSRCGDIALDGSVTGTPMRLDFAGDVNTSLGEVTVTGGHFERTGDTRRIAGHVATGGLELGHLLAKEDLLGSVALDATVDATLSGGSVNGNFDGHVDHVDLKGYRYHDITANVSATQNHYNGHVTLNDPNGKINIEGEALLAGAASTFDATVQASGVHLATLLQRPVPIEGITALDLEAHLRGNNAHNLQGDVRLNNLTMLDKHGEPLELNGVELSATDHRVALTSPFVHGAIEGDYDFATLPTAINNMLAASFPAMFSHRASSGDNDFDFSFTIDPDEKWQERFNLPVKLVYRATLDGHLNERNGSLAARLNVPYLQQGNKIIDATSVRITKDGSNQPLVANVATHIPMKSGKLTLAVDASGHNNAIDANLGWNVAREREFRGDISLTAALSRALNGRLAADVNINPATLVFNDTAWNVNGGHIGYDGHAISVSGLNASCDKQFINIHGNVSSDPNDELEVVLNDISLDYIFNTLQINHVTFGGRATGNFTLADLFSKQPRLMTPNLHVENMYYNGALMGDADIESHWDNENKAVVLNCDLAQQNGKHTTIGGSIFTAADSLYLTFDADHANVKFMKPFMAAFTSDVDGEVSGHAVLFGNFKTIDLKGDIYAHDLKLKIDYTNCYYTCSDSIHIVPGYIPIDNVVIHDRDGHEARLNGYLKHNAFHDPVFNFTVTEARDLLCYDITEAMNPDWYGTIYGNGSAIISGEPGLVKISVNMQSADRSKFTFVLSDAEVANEYNFITFRDRDKALEPELQEVAQQEVDTVPEIVKLLTRRIEQQNQSAPSTIAVDLRVDITPEAQLILVMDPVGGDKIRANGNGNLRLNYDSTNDEFEMFGRYVLTKGNYNFTLQDIIIKDFTIREGSTISFDGDPYNAMLDIEAIYSLNANIRDLDESFATDRDINRTTVPVHALLRIKGDITEPELSFDLEFPTLTTEAYRKVKSVISTDDMMNRQIIYLLALNRFYTPDYMNASSTTTGSEFTSVASSTISSQLSSMLGQLSDNWTIAPNFRTDRGDFSDVEVDVALSSQLLNNRLILNGNIGYRDNTYNPRNSNFIGDFDLEYLLNRQGTIRLKAYNHFNDQSYYYVRNAMTTQGVGIVFKRDFDNLLQFRSRKEKNDTVPAAPLDSVPQPAAIASPTTPQKQ